MPMSKNLRTTAREVQADRKAFEAFMNSNPPTLFGDGRADDCALAWCTNMEERFHLLKIRGPLQLSMAACQLKVPALSYWKEKLRKHPDAEWNIMKEGILRNFTPKGFEEKITRQIYRRNSETWRMMPEETFEDYYHRFNNTFSRRPESITDEELIQLFWDKLSDFEKTVGKAKFYKLPSKPSGFTLEEFLSDMEFLIYPAAWLRRNFPSGSDEEDEDGDSLDDWRMGSPGEESEEDPSEDDPDED